MEQQDGGGACNWLVDSNETTKDLKTSKSTSIENVKTHMESGGLYTNSNTENMTGGDLAQENSHQESTCCPKQNLDNNDDDPVYDYHKEAKMVCKKLLEYLK